MLAKGNPLTRMKHKLAWDSFCAQNLEKARELYRQICEKDRCDAKAWAMLGMIYGRLNELSDAEASLSRALEIDPENLDALTNLGLVFHRKGLPEQSMDCYRKALARHPDHADTLFGLGNAYALAEQLTMAQRCYESVLEQIPRHAGALVNLANVLAYQGCAMQALSYYRQQLNYAPRIDGGIYSNMLLCLHYPHAHDPAAIFDEHLAWASLYERGGFGQSVRPSGFDPDRKLRIGYVTPDLRGHSVAYFFEPMLVNHDRKRFEIYCYVESASSDTTAKRLWQLPDRVQNTNGLSDERMDAMIRADRIDILVDLAGHTDHNRLPVFARKPAPIQITYLGYPNTTGLRAMDYRITDGWADPPGMTERWHTEKLIRLENGFLCFAPPAEAPEISPLPAFERGYVTYGSFNALTKITPEMLSVWAQILHETTDSRLLIKNKQLTDRHLQQRLYAQLERHGVPRERVEMLGRTSKEEHMATYGKVDIALDSFPYHGTTTTCDTLWMGIPVITRAGNTHVSRVGVSLLTRVGLGQLVADDDREYIDQAVRLASDLESLSELRHGLRQMFRQSGLGDGAAFTGQIESVYRRLWRERGSDGGVEVQ